MAWSNYGWAWNVQGARGAKFIMILFFADESDKTGRIKKTSIQRIMSKCRISRSTAFRHLKQLDEQDLVKRLTDWKYNGQKEYSSFQINLRRYFPKGVFNDGMTLWKEILKYIEDHFSDEIPPTDFHYLKRFEEAWLVKNSRTLWVVTDVDIYQETLLKHRRIFKKACFLLKSPIHRFEVFRRPYFRD